MTKHSYYVRYFGYIFMVAVVSDICVQSVTLFLFLSFKISFFSNIFGQSYFVVFFSLYLSARQQSTQRLIHTNTSITMMVCTHRRKCHKVGVQRLRLSLYMYTLYRDRAQNFQVRIWPVCCAFYDLIYHSFSTIKHYQEECVFAVCFVIISILQQNFLSNGNNLVIIAEILNYFHIKQNYHIPHAKQHVNYSTCQMNEMRFGLNYRGVPCNPCYTAYVMLSIHWLACTSLQSSNNS